MLEGFKAAGAFIALVTAAGFCFQAGRAICEYVELQILDWLDRDG